jgi:fibronectin type 3 domain-containing protein
VLTWNASPDVGVTGYRVYYSTSSGKYTQAYGSGIAAGNTTTFTVSSLPSGYTYFFAVTAIDAAGQESAYSNEVTKSIP